MAPKKEKAPPPSSKPAKSGGGKQKKKTDVDNVELRLGTRKGKTKCKLKFEKEKKALLMKTSSLMYSLKTLGLSLFAKNMFGIELFVNITSDYFIPR